MITYDFTDRVAFVTGAAAGMGAATARSFAQAGAATAIVDRDIEVAERFATELTGEGLNAIAIGCDVADELQVKNAVDTTVAIFGRLDVAFNNAGIMLPPVGAADETADAFNKIVSVNLQGVWASMKYELAQMREQGSGSIVNCSSLGGLVGGNGRATYHATKHGVIGQTKSVALEYAPLGIRVNAVCPGTIDTPMVERMTAGGELDSQAALAAIPMGRLGHADEIAAAVLWLCSDAASYVTGVALPVDGAYTAQ
ncbi:glucose 1-dehydrogenase [Mycolicibacter longobardus]|uniref:Oxidoreductase n=1 Tax=Mycolicibacter longobardus TaxID=1108812 RepID=A0A1X1YKD4_9MYCO|nr:glucose 1-dehydrogenase [Mycolicibacter longobardus]MCV7383905.1 glucose 1-dehydrogenase [Mycolicibacter longobardus]ORW11514.1 oxidoreductase [Mycolicibacter longobardus]